MPSTRHSTAARLSLEDLERVVLKSGAHDRRSLTTLCILEAVAWVAGEEHSDHPECASQIISGFLRSWNDAMNDEDRQMLKPLVPRLVNTAATPEIELQRSYMALDWHCRVSAPTWLRTAGLIAEAEAIETTDPIVDAATCHAAQASLDTAKQAAYVAGAAAWAAAWDAAGAAAWDAAWDAAWAAARAELRPTVVTLQASALELVQRLIVLSEAQP